MKKILLASTALVLSAGIAGAQGVSITGTGRMGIMGANAGAGWVWNLENRMTLNFTATVEADHGLTFGAWMRARNGSGTSNGFSGSRVWVEANNLRLTFGNTDGAVRGAGTAFGYAGGCGIGYEGGQQCGDSLGLLPVTHGQNSTGGIADQRVRIDYSFGDTRVALSHDRFANTTEIGVRSSFNAFTVAAGYMTIADIYTISAAYNGGSWNVGAMIAANSVATNWQINGSVELGGGTAYAYVGEVFGANAYGVNYAYGLGGGANLVAGAERVGGLTTASIGVNFSF